MADSTYTVSRRKLLRYASYATGASLLAACQLGPVGDGAVRTSAPTSSGAVKRGGTLIVGAAEPATLENTLALPALTARYLYEIYDRLVELDFTAEVPFPPQIPGLATSWTISPDGTIYTFKLRQGVTFHDGTPFDAAALKFNLDRIRDPNFPYYYQRGAGATSFVFGRVAETVVVDPSTVRIQLSEPFGNFIDALMRKEASFASPESIKRLGNEKNGESPVGTGPFKFVQREPGSKVVFARNASYWGGAPPLDQVIVRVISEPTAAVSALLSKEVHFINTVPPDSVGLIESHPDFAVVRANVPSNFVVMYNMRQQPMNDVRVRQALNYALDRETYIRDIMKGLAKPAKAFFSPNGPVYNPDLKGYSYDIDKAKALLREAGLESGFSFTLLAGSAESTRNAAVFIKDSLAKVRVNVDLQLIEPNALSATMSREGTKPGVGGVFWSWDSDNAFNFDRFFSSAFGPPNGVNWGFYGNPAVDKLIADAARTPDKAERIKIYQNAERLIADDAAFLFFYYAVEVRAYQKKLHWTSANNITFTLRNAWLDD
jgi:peptide/nickel transport system substrate-binding protein